MEIISHRGLWTTDTEKNTRPAFEKSFSEGFGTETDVRDYCGQLVVSHDIPGEGAMPWRTFLELYVDTRCPGALAVNIKSDGLQDLLLRSFAELGVTNYFLFDMAVPDLMQSIRAGLPCFTRQSDVEPTPVLIDSVAGVWLDAFEGLWFGPELIHSHLVAGKKVCIVSPELHRIDRTETWNAYRDWGLHHHDQVLLCTDFPREAKEFFHVD